ncbi:transposase [Streptomyces violascens]|uniref:transposase n=1 Tax=Streptomyces violascens TaxID=67381 RepID=UPI00364B39DB
MTSLLYLIGILDAEEPPATHASRSGRVDTLGARLSSRRPCVGQVLAAVLVGASGDLHCFTSADKLCSWAGLTPRHYESDTLVRRGHVTKQGSKLLRRSHGRDPAQGDPPRSPKIGPGSRPTAAGTSRQEHRQERRSPQTVILAGRLGDLFNGAPCASCRRRPEAVGGGRAPFGWGFRCAGGQRGDVGPVESGPCAEVAGDAGEECGCADSSAGFGCA